ncbi:hypothetical protein AYO44_07640 [Planctomycetaceae bacterium SCGC AG-212-F19]|nr:hypothetical protein AYO44_07640 [Planctomycetaceae bacterium SCGC AG-212-F19]
MSSNAEQIAKRLEGMNNWSEVAPLLKVLADALEEERHPAMEVIRYAWFDSRPDEGGDCDGNLRLPDGPVRIRWSRFPQERWHRRASDYHRGRPWILVEKVAIIPRRAQSPAKLLLATESSVDLT